MADAFAGMSRTMTEGVPDLAGAASATLPNSQDQQQIAQQLIQRLVQARLGGSGGLTTGPEMSKPMMPLPPQEISPKGVIPQGPFASVGSRKRADTQALFSNISDIVQGAEKKHYEMKVQKLQHDFETMSNAMRGFEEAKASGNQEMMKHNADIINSIVSDPKKSKELAKAFDVNMNPMANEGGKGKKEKPNPANDALKASFVKDQKAYANKQTMLSPQAQAMMRQVPQTTQVDPATQLRMQLTEKGVLPKAGEELTFTKDLIDIARKMKDKEITLADKDKLAEWLIKSSERKLSVQQSGALIRVMTQVAGAKDRMEILERMWTMKADKTLEGIKDRTKAMRDKLGDSAGDKQLVIALKGISDSATANAEEMKVAQKNHDTKKMQELSRQSDMIKFQMGLITAEAAKRTGLDPEDFSIGSEPQMDPATQSLWGLIFHDATQDNAGEDNPDK